MPKRSKYELKIIYHDLLEIKDVTNYLYEKGSFSSLPFKLKGKSASDKKKEFFQEFVDKWRNLLLNEKIISCECTAHVKFAINFWEEIRDEKFNFLHLPILHRNSKEIKTNNGLSFDKLIELISKILKGSATPSEEKKVNEALDDFGKCNIVHTDIDILKEAQTLAFNPKQITISEKQEKMPNPKAPYLS